MTMVFRLFDIFLLLLIFCISVHTLYYTSSTTNTYAYHCLSDNVEILNFFYCIVQCTDEI